MSTEKDRDTEAIWTQHDQGSWECTVRSAHGEAVMEVSRNRDGSYKSFLHTVEVRDPSKGQELMQAALKLCQERGISAITTETTSSARVKDMFGVLGQHAVVRDIVEDNFEAVAPIKAIHYLDTASKGQERSVVIRAELREVEIQGRAPREKGDIPPRTNQREKEPKEQTRDREPGKIGVIREINPDKGQSRDPDDGPGGGGASAPKPEPPTPQLPTGSSAANREAGRSPEVPQKDAPGVREMDPHQRTPEGNNPSSKEQSRDPQQKTGPERGVEPELGGKPANGSAQLQSAVQQKVQEITPGRELDGIGEAAEQQARAKSREAAIAAAIERARETAKSTRKPSLGERITKKVREVVPGIAPQHEREPANGPGLLPSKITPEMQREADLGRALQSRGVDQATIWAYRDRGWSLSETLAAVKAVEREERGGTLPAQGKSRETGMQPQGVARDPHMDALAAVVKAHTVTRTPRVEQPTQAQELARQKEEDNNRQSLKFISEQLAMGRKLEQDRAQQRTLAIAQIRKETPSLTLELVRRENERQANAPGRTKRSGPELGPRGIERGR